MKLLIILFVAFFAILSHTNLLATNPLNNGGEYTLVIEGYDWGPAVSKVILSLTEPVSTANFKTYTVQAKRSTECTELSEENASGERTVVNAYVSDANGKRMEEGKHITLVLSVNPNISIDSPIQYTRGEKCRGNNWVDYKLTVTDKSTNQIWDKEINRIMPIIDKFDHSGKFVYNKDLTMSYADFEPEVSGGKKPLIIWLHGGGEGGTDPTIPLIANRAANYASDEIQDIFGGAYVLVPQCPGAWMHNAKGVTTHGKENDIYNEGLMALIKDYVTTHSNIDTDRIYVGGCSNGGYMALKLILLYPDYFAAGYISALAYQSQYISDEDIERIKDVPMWFIHSADDRTTVPDQTVLPVYERLTKAGAKDVHLSYYDHVTDLTGFFGGENHHFNGHWSWIYSHANHSTKSIDGKSVTIMEWMAAKSK